MGMKTFGDVVGFHGHACPGLALGYRVAALALRELGRRSADEELVAIVENDSCAVDAVQVLTGCTFGKGNLIFRDYGKQVYTFIKRPEGEGMRISVDFAPPDESDEEKNMWEQYARGDRSAKVVKSVHARKTKKMHMILRAKDADLFRISRVKVTLPDEAHIYPSLRCVRCGEKVMETRARVREGKPVCIPCSEGKVQNVRQKRTRKNSAQ
ncbi:MAG: FmdE family protein [Nitrospirota bacterium]